MSNHGPGHPQHSRSRRNARVPFMPQSILLSLLIIIITCITNANFPLFSISSLSVLPLTFPSFFSPSLSEFFMPRSLSLAFQMCRQTVTSLSKPNVTTERINEVKEHQTHASFFFFYSTVNLILFSSEQKY